MSMCISVIIPARNEAALIAQTVETVLSATMVLQAAHPTAQPFVEVIVIDNASTDQTKMVLEDYRHAQRIRVLSCNQLGAAYARNVGVSQAAGEILVFLDADTLMPPDALQKIFQHCVTTGYIAGITALAPAERGWRAQLWWWFWSQVRRLPLPHAKAMPALMFCTRAAFTNFGPFDESVSIGEEWPILAGVYRANPYAFMYDRTIIARSSSRRMELQPFGYARTFARYLWAVLHRSGRIAYPDTIRHQDDSSEEYTHAHPILRGPLGDRLRCRPIAPATRRNDNSGSFTSDGS